MSEYQGGAVSTSSPVSIGENVARLRKDLRLSQEQLAAHMRSAGATHWRQNTVSRVETGKQEPTFLEVVYLAGILGTEVYRGTALAAQLDRVAMFEPFPERGAPTRVITIGFTARAAGCALDASRQLYEQSDHAAPDALRGVEARLIEALELVRQARKAIDEGASDGQRQEA